MSEPVEPTAENIEDQLRAFELTRDEVAGLVKQTAETLDKKFSDGSFRSSPLHEWSMDEYEVMLNDRMRAIPDSTPGMVTLGAIIDANPIEYKEDSRGKIFDDPFLSKERIQSLIQDTDVASLDAAQQATRNKQTETLKTIPDVPSGIDLEGFGEKAMGIFKKYPNATLFGLGTTGFLLSGALKKIPLIGGMLSGAAKLVAGAIAAFGLARGVIGHFFPPKMKSDVDASEAAETRGGEISAIPSAETEIEGITTEAGTEIQALRAQTLVMLETQSPHFFEQAKDREWMERFNSQKTAEYSRDLPRPRPMYDTVKIEGYTADSVDAITDALIENGLDVAVQSDRAVVRETVESYLKQHMSGENIMTSTRLVQDEYQPAPRYEEPDPAVRAEAEHRVGDGSAYISAAALEEGSRLRDKGLRDGETASTNKGISNPRSREEEPSLA